MKLQDLAYEDLLGLIVSIDSVLVTFKRVITNWTIISVV